MVHVIATVLGLSALFSHSPTLYTIVKLAGAAYLIYLGVNYWKSNSLTEDKDIAQTRKKPLRTVFLESIIVEVTNPKTALFFIALLPQFVMPESGSIWQQLLVLGIIVTITALPCDLFVAVFASKASDWILNNERAQRIQNRISGSILFGMGAYIVVDEAVSLNE